MFISGRRGDVQTLLAAVLHINEMPKEDFVFEGPGHAVKRLKLEICVCLCACVCVFVVRHCYYIIHREQMQKTLAG